MKVLVTGGNRGLGLAIVNAFQGTSLSRTESNLDITKDLDAIANISLDYDIFINNAFDGPPQEGWANFAQTNLYLKVYDAWKMRNKAGYIFNIGSIGSESIVSPEPRFETYRISKAALQHASYQGTQAFKENLVAFKTTLIVPDRLDTPLTRSRPNWTGNGVDCNDIIDFIRYATTTRGNTVIRDIAFYCNLNFENSES